ncbi:hypothetical protein BH23GEM6_BH23GEM6_11320 [soil metagenome]
MPTLLNHEDSAALERRFSQLQSDTPARWGKFTAPQMLSHVIQSLGMMAGSVEMTSGPGPWVVRNWPLKHLLIYVLPFPKGLPTSPELLARASLPVESAQETWPSELDALRQALEPLVMRGDRGTKWPDHVAFGPMSGRQWGVLQYRHLDHHLRQFGL